MKIMTAGTDTKLLDQKVYFANGGVYSAVIQPNPEKTSEVGFSFIEILVLYFCGYTNFYIAFYNVHIASFRVATG